MVTTVEQEIPSSLSKWIDRLIVEIPTYEKVLYGEIETHGTVLEKVRRIEELTRIVNAFQSTFNSLENEHQDFILEYYYNSEREPTIEAASRKSYISVMTGNRWKKSFVEQIAKRLGWL